MKASNNKKMGLDSAKALGKHLFVFVTVMHKKDESF